jgi:hypothetical protein
MDRILNEQNALRFWIAHRFKGLDTDLKYSDLIYFVSAI